MYKWKLYILFFYEGIQTIQVKKAIARARHFTYIYRTTHKALYKSIKKNYLVLKKTVGMAKYSLNGGKVRSVWGLNHLLC